MSGSGSLFGDLSPAGRTGERKDEHSPLAERVRPETLDLVVGLEKLIGSGGFLRQAIETDQIPSMIFWGPPGSGKTTLARIIANRTKARFIALSAVTSGIKEVKAALDDARRLRQVNQTRTIVFIDEIHRFNRAQQDAFLPFVESGDIILIGATTENPSFEVNSALLSRTRVIVLEQLDHQQILLILRRGLQEPLIRNRRVTLEDDAIEFMASISGGDARQALNSLEMVIRTSAPDRRLSAADVREILSQRALRYDKSGDEHFNLISALHKAVRNSEPDASVYWLTRMLEGGEDPMYLARRMVRMAVEDIGLAEPEALRQAIAVRDATHFLGMPEAGVALAQLAIYLAQAPKSNAVYVAYETAREQIRTGDTPPVPLHIRNAPTALMRDLGYGEGYEYAHSSELATTAMSSMPDELADLKLYRPTSHGFEAEVASRLEEIERKRDVARQRAGSRKRVRKDGAD